MVVLSSIHNPGEIPFFAVNCLVWKYDSSKACLGHLGSWDSNASN